VVRNSVVQFVHDANGYVVAMRGNACIHQYRCVRPSSSILASIQVATGAMKTVIHVLLQAKKGDLYIFCLCMKEEKGTGGVCAWGR
jgi:hypothetical protein